ncbi:hypothetical protein SporoP37_03550 [Sporosarcina sp. P37]|uniref:hypothetical protein n=1 Tax=unclassified Sporosarcina TaxID=2647733 RepID=UPI0009BEC739|nr:MULTISPECIES: hypothetical protein [unclassified Sporosarcina]ARD47299.1 hypothetical protein SporoP33_02870 [Sporosarcina sp. P33]ARK23864.1 hypothetical protein SporoP37_03550 [Sporosarcina sp. P37]PID17815.1 hypothetical protein CSV62_11650 [Sporosarcina sp. P35]
MDSRYWKVGFFASLISFVLLILGVRTILGHDLVVNNYLTFAVFGLIVGIVSSLLLFYQLPIAFKMFMVTLVLAFAEMFRSFLMMDNEFSEAIGILSLFIISSFGLAISVIVQFIVKLLRKK